MKKKMLVFGGSGFLGKHFLAAESDNELFCVNRKSKHLMHAKKNFTYNCKKEILESGPFDFVIDFASNVSVEHYLNSPLKSFLENVKIPIKNLRLLSEIKFGGKYFLISSDRALVKNVANKYFNTAELNIDPYAASKFVAEILVSYAAGLNWDRPTIITFPNIYGPYQTSSQLIPKIIKTLKSGKNVVKVNSLQGSRNYLYIDDAVDAIQAILKMPEPKKHVMISGKNIKIKKIIDTLGKLMKHEFGRHVIFQNSENNIKRKTFKLPPSKLDDSSFREISGWRPKFNMHDGLLKLLEEEFKC